MNSGHIIEKVQISLLIYIIMILYQVSLSGLCHQKQFGKCILVPACPRDMSVMQEPRLYIFGELMRIHLPKRLSNTFAEEN